MPRRTNDELVLQPVTEITGRLSPKSIVASGTGLYFAQNMMYQHTISVFDADKELVATLEDSVDLGAFGYDVAGGVYRGAPVEAVFTSDGSHVFVSNYRMYGPGYDPNAGGDSCGKDRGQQSFVYRIDTTSLEIDRVYEAGPVPKSVAVTPDDRLLLVSNWCGFDVSVIDLQTDETLAEIEVGRYPRGIAVTSEGSTAYVAVTGSTDIAVIDLSAVSSGGTLNGAAGEFDGLSYLQGVGAAPRHLILSPDDEVLYVSLNGEDAVVAIDVDTGLELMRVRTGTKPRSMDISDDGTALYVVNYESNTMTKLRTRDFTELQRLATAHHPIGITYDSFNDEVWVSAYAGVIHVYAERASDEPPCTPADCEADTNTADVATTATPPNASQPPTATATTDVTTAASETPTPTTVPSSQTTSQDHAVVSDTPGLGVVITSTGLVLPVRDARDGSYLVGTTCANEVVVSGGTHVERADVVLDPGHGGSETGAVGANGLIEKHLNLAVARLARAELEARGYRTVLTRNADIRMPTVTRAEIALALSAKAFVSIHHNGGVTQSSPDPGTEVFHQGRSPDSLRLAGILFEDLQTALSQYDVPWAATRNKGTKGLLRSSDDRDLYGVLRHSEGLPAVLVEPAYLSNPSEARLLADAAVQAVEARAIADGIVRFLTTDDPGSGFNDVTTTSRVLTTGGRNGCVDPPLN